jgi:hypothetical protein
MILNLSKNKKMKVFQLESQNDVQKIFKSQDIDVYVGKAFDEETDKHFLIFSIPVIPEVNVQHIQFPYVFDTEKERDEVFTHLEVNYISEFIEKLIAQIEENKKKALDESNIQN